MKDLFGLNIPPFLFFGSFGCTDLSISKERTAMIFCMYVLSFVGFYVKQYIFFAESIDRKILGHLQNQLTGVVLEFTILFHLFGTDLNIKGFLSCVANVHRI